MAIKSSIRSPSPISSKQNSRNGQENMDTGRRSFISNGSKSNKPCSVSQPRILNPIVTSANTHNEYSRRSSYGGRDYELKENEQDINPQHPLLRSPSVVKGSKNFMSPTISAASKINASPRKKVLGERNEAVRTSALYSSGKFQFYSTAPLETETYAVHDHESELKLKPEYSPQTATEFQNECTENLREEPVSNLTGADDDKKEPEPDVVVLGTLKSFECNGTEAAINLTGPQTRTEFQNECTENLMEEPAINLTGADDDKKEPEPDVVVLSPLKSFKCNERESPNKELVTNSGDSMLPPYDPNNNYLSPRPQFLHYKPKPRVEAYLNRGIQFEDEFAPDNSYETQGSDEETTPSKDSGEQTPESLQYSEPSQSLLISECSQSSQISECCNSQLTEKNVDSEVATKHKSSCFTLSKALVFILVMSLAFPLAIHAPSITATWNHHPVISKFVDESHKVADLAREHMESWCDNLKSKLVHSFGHLSLITAGFGKAKKLGTLKYINVTDLPDYDGMDYEFEKFKVDTFGVEKGRAEFVSDKMEISEYDGMDYEFEQVMTDTSGEQNVNIELDSDKMRTLGNTEEYMYVDYPNVENDLESDNHVGFSDKIQATQPYLEVDELQEISESSAPEDIAVENVLDYSEAVATEQESARENTDAFLGIADEPQTVIEDEEHLSTLSTGRDLERSTSLAFGEWKAKLMEVVDSLKQLLSENTVATSVISTAALLLVTILVCLKLRKHFPQQQVENSKPPSKSIAACNIKPQTSCSQSGPATEEFEEMEGESCPSEMSSSQRCEKSICSSSSRRENHAAADEVHSHERNNSLRKNHKHESLVSTSSYGSFTAYSIVQNKNGDEEVVTPLRRSSRIRNKVTYS